MNNQTPMHPACLEGNAEVVKYLMEVLKMDVGEWVHNEPQLSITVYG